jgi:hypothetical protein
LTSSPLDGILSKFTTNTSITAQNAASNWTGGSDNIYRAKLSSRYVTQLDALTLAILKKGSSMTDAQFKSYLANLSTGITRLGWDARFVNDTEIQNILGFLTYEVNSTVTAMNTNSTATTAIWELAGLINNTSTSDGNSQNTTVNSAQIAEQKRIHDQYFTLTQLKSKVVTGWNYDTVLPTGHKTVGWFKERFAVDPTTGCAEQDFQNVLVRML